MTDKNPNAQDTLENLITRRGIYYQAFSIYKEIGGFYDYGPIGVRIKHNIETAWRSIFIDGTSSLEVESTLIMPEAVFKASGHLASFTDPMVNCIKCKKPVRADKLLEEFYEKAGNKNAAASVEKLSLEDMAKMIKENGIKCKNCGGELSAPEHFNMMFKTNIGSLGGEVGYLRPETAQGIFVDFRNLFRIYGLKLPIGIGQIGKVFRNEISPRQHWVRLREFTQMELEVFFDPEAEQKEFGGIEIDSILNTRIAFVAKGSETEVTESLRKLLEQKMLPNRLFAALLYLEDTFLKRLGFKEGAYRFRAIENPPHYSGGNVDIEVKTSYGYIEITGNAYRTSYDLSAHAKLSGSDLGVVNADKKVVPHVVEASIGLDRTLFSLLEGSMRADTERGWSVLGLNDNVAPYRYGVFPLQKDEKLVEKAKGLSKALGASGISNYYSEASSIGKRYAKADEIGIPKAITVDYQTLEDDTVTVRTSTDAKQVRIKIGEID